MQPEQQTALKRSIWLGAAFYALIAFEFFYMAGPFAAYFYTVYRPGLKLFADTPRLAWLADFFLPHLALETSSALVDALRIAGAALAIGGFAAFCLGAGQVYYAKLRRRGMVAGGVYNYLRHPQYLALAVCGLGVLLLWPRYLIVVFYVTMLFAYYLLALLEERECAAKFGASYLEYRRRTGMFLPFLISGREHRQLKNIARPWKFLLALVVYLGLLAGSLLLAASLRSISVAGLYTYADGSGIYISLVKLDPTALRRLAELAASDNRVAARLGSAAPGTFLINYVLPADMYISEIPMAGNETRAGDHFLYSHSGASRFKIIFTAAALLRGAGPDALANLREARGVTPLLEAWLDVKSGLVEIAPGSPPSSNYAGLPMPLF